MAATWIGLLPAIPLAGFEPFAVSMALSALAITLTRPVPPAVAARAASPARLARSAPLGVRGCFGTGLSAGGVLDPCPGRRVSPRPTRRR